MTFAQLVTSQKLRKVTYTTTIPFNITLKRQLTWAKWKLPTGSHFVSLSLKHYIGYRVLPKPTVGQLRNDYMLLLAGWQKIPYTNLPHTCALFELEAIIWKIPVSLKIPGEKFPSTCNYRYRFCLNFEYRTDTATGTDCATGIPYRKFSGQNATLLSTIYDWLDATNWWLSCQKQEKHSNGCW